MKRGRLALLVILVAGCDVIAPGSKVDLSLRRSNWERLDLRNYTFDYIRSCFCGGPAGDTLRVVVRGDTVFSLTNLGPRNPPGSIPSSYRVTIDDLFDELQRAIDDDADTIEIDYDNEFSFPRRASIDFLKNAIDDELEFRITRFLRQ